jgi:hypothetical protein
MSFGFPGRLQLQRRKVSGVAFARVSASDRMFAASSGKLIGFDMYSTISRVRTLGAALWCSPSRTPLLVPVLLLC